MASRGIDNAGRIVEMIISLLPLLLQLFGVSVSGDYSLDTTASGVGAGNAYRSAKALVTGGSAKV